MKPWFTSSIFVALAVSLCGAQGPSPVGHPSQSAMQSSASSGQQHGVFQVELTKTLDCKKLKPGDMVEAKVLSQVNTPNGTMIPRGAKVTGHVTEVKTRSKGDANSQLGIVFDKISRPGGEDLSMKAVIQALAPNPNADVTTGGGIGYGGMSETMEKPLTPSGGAGPVPLLNEQSTGVLGIKNLELGSDGVLTSSGKDIKLDSGTRVLLNATL